jgi:8-oxo-dGTP pyrophosphatase MutT (NUDIX family)
MLPNAVFPESSSTENALSGVSPADPAGLQAEESIIRLLLEQPTRSADTLEPDTKNAGLRPAAVLAPLVWFNKHWSLLFTRRTETVNSHKGQVSFPGGVADPEDHSPEATALRETYEEIGLRPEDVRILGRLSTRTTVSSYLITPVVGRVRWPNEFRISTHEVSRIFTIPLDWLADSANREERPRTFSNGRKENIIYYQAYDGEILWGATARITVDLLRALGLIR